MEERAQRSHKQWELSSWSNFQVLWSSEQRKC